MIIYRILILAAILSVAVLLALFSGCKNSLTGDDDHNNTGSYRLYAAYEGNLNHGILIIDLEELTVVDSVLLDGVPFDLLMSSDSSLLFVATSKNIVTIDLHNYSITEVYDLPAIWLGVSKDDRFIFAANNKVFTVIGRQANTILYTEDSLSVRAMAADPIELGVYVAFLYPDSPNYNGGIFHYSAITDMIDRTYHIMNGSEPAILGPADMALRHDGKQLFLTNNQAAGGQTTLYVLDLETGEQIQRDLPAVNAKMAVTSDDRYVYITDPDFWLSTWRVPSGILRRYDIASRTVEQYIDFREYEITENFNAWPVIDQIALLPSDRTCIVTGEVIMAWDLAEKKLLGKIALGLGKHTQRVRAIALGPGCVGAIKGIFHRHL